MSACQTEVLPLPTVLLSSHTGEFDNIYVRYLTVDMQGFCGQWKRLDFRVDGLVGGYFKSEEELGLVSQLSYEKKDSSFCWILLWVIMAVSIKVLIETM